jgi:ectoine hydroxylase-related dioxygenase (phytanoyl-CoA dioxygenase family)
MIAGEQVSRGDGQPGLKEAGHTPDIFRPDASRPGMPRTIWGDGLPRLREADTASTVSARLEESGFAIIPGALSPAGLADLNSQLTPWFDQALAGRGPFLGRRTRRFSALFARAPRTIDLAINPAILGIVQKVLKDDGIQINLTQAIAIDPGEPAQPLHRDDEMFPARLPAEAMVNVLWTLDDFTDANGATRVVPGSHRWPKEQRGRDLEGVAAEAPAGSAILWLGSTIHGGGGNRTKLPRRGLIISYSLGWLAPAEKLLLSIPQDVARGLPRRLQRLIGYQVHHPNLGWVEGRDPIEWLEGRVKDLAAADDNLLPGFADRVERIIASRPPLNTEIGAEKVA